MKTLREYVTTSPCATSRSRAACAMSSAALADKSFCVITRLSREMRRDVLYETLELVELVGAGETDAEIGHPGGFVTLQGVDDCGRCAEPHEAAEVDAAAVVFPQEFGRHCFGFGGVVLDAHG